MESGFTKISQGKIYYEYYKAIKTSQAESRQCPTIVLIHGNTLDLRMWEPQIKFLSKQYNVLVYDMRGFGKSPIPDEPYSRHKDLLELIDSLNIKKVIVVGISLGALVAVDFANAYPQKTLGLIALSPVISFWQSNTELGLYWKKLIEIQKTKGDKAAKNFWLKAKLFENLDKNIRAKSMIKMILADYSCWNLKGIDPRIHPQIDPTKNLDNIKCKTLIMFGEKDMQVFIDCAKFLHEKIKNSKLIAIQDASHLINLERIDFVNKIINNFL